MIKKITALTVAVSLIAIVMSFMTKTSVHARGLEDIWFQQNERANVNGFKLSPVSISNITWFDCPLYSSSPYPVYENDTQGELEIPMAECAQVPLPLDYSVAAPDTTNIFVFIKRLRQKQANKKALWFLTGTPSSFDFESIIKNNVNVLDQFDVYTMDHRGLGNSHRLGCASNQAESTGMKVVLLLLMVK